MSVPQKIWLQFIVDAQYRSRWVDYSGGIPVVKISSPPVFLPQLARGWKEALIAFGTNIKYWSLIRSYSQPLFFVNDGAIICRDAIYSAAKKGYEEELYILILKLNPATGVYDLEYKGRLEFSKHIDMPRKGITVNSIEGGVFSYLTANDNVDYALPLSPLNPDVNLLTITGVKLHDTFRYSVIDLTVEKPSDFDHHAVAYLIPFPFISNDGDSVGIISGSQRFEQIVNSGTFTYSMVTAVLATSSNYFFSSIRPVTVTPAGRIFVSKNNGGAAVVSMNIWFETSLGNKYQVLPLTVYPAGNIDVDIDIAALGLSIPLAANEKLFLVHLVNSLTTFTTFVTWHLTDVFFSFETINPPSNAYSLSIIDVHKQLVSAMTGGRYTGNSVYYSAHREIQFTSTNALQNYAFEVYYGSFQTVNTAGIYTIVIPGKLKTLPSNNQLLISGAPSNNGIYTILNVGPLVAGYTTITVQEPVTSATLDGIISSIPALVMTYQDFFNDVDCLSKENGAGIGMKIVNDVIWIEPKEELYKPDTEIFDIGEIAGLKLYYADELLANSLLTGYKSQDYRQRNGIYEFNTTTLFKLPVDSLQRELKRVLKSRADCFGIEFIRSNIFNKPTTDITGDNQPVVIDTVPFTGTMVVNFFATNQTMIIPLGIAISTGDVIAVTGSGTNVGTWTVGATSMIPTGMVLFLLSGPTIVDETNATVTITLVTGKSRIVNRPAYTTLVGVLDNTVYNTEISPHKLMLRFKMYLASLLSQLLDKKIVFQKADKNSSLSTTLAGVTVAERQDEVVAGLGDPLFIPRYAEFVTPVQISFAKVMANIGTGYVKGTFYGVPIYFLPIGEMQAKPAINEAQTWKMLLAPPPLNDLAVLEKLSDEGLFTNH